MPGSLCLLGLVLVLAACSSVPHYADDMRGQHDGGAPVPTATTGVAGDGATERVDYATVDGEAVTGVLARPEGVEGPAPGLIVIHEWWGLTDNVEAITRRFADRGVLAHAVDPYGGDVAATSDSAMGLLRAAMGRGGALTETLRQAYAYLATQETAPRVGVVGWCFGGMWSLWTALALPDRIDATVSYYGRPVTDASWLEALDMPVLGLFGGADDSIPADTVDAFAAAVLEAGVAHDTATYPGVAHAIANPSGQAYDPTAAEDAGQRTTAFLRENLQTQTAE